MTFIYTLEELPNITTKLLKLVTTRTLFFYGEMGVGKTTLIKEICKQLGVEDRVSSPTFSLVNEYQGRENLVYHFDFYRIESEEEVYNIGFEEYFDDQNWALIEWPEKIPNLLPDYGQTIKIVQNSNGNRQLHIV